MTAPSPAQLEVLVDRAARRLGADEGELLRAGFASLVAARRSAGGLQAANQRLRAELAAALGGSASDAPGSAPCRRQEAAQGSGGGIPAGDAPGASEGRSTASPRTGGRAPSP